MQVGLLLQVPTAQGEVLVSGFRGQGVDAVATTPHGVETETRKECADEPKISPRGSCDERDDERRQEVAAHARHTLSDVHEHAPLVDGTAVMQSSSAFSPGALSPVA